jgi:hypothetical protein
MDSGDVYVYDTATGKSTQLSSGNTAQTPVVSGNVVVWSGSGSILCYITDRSTGVKPDYYIGISAIGFSLKMQSLQLRSSLKLDGML